MHDLQVIGHVTIDRIETRAGFLQRAGGSAIYAPLAFARLGGDVGVLTRMAPEDEADLLAEPREAGIEVVCAASPKTTEFENRYREQDRDRRVQRVGAVALPFVPEDLAGIEARVLHLGPLTRDDISVAVIAAAAERGRVSLDAQGLVRAIVRGAVEAADWPEKEAGLARVSVLKADEHEARVLTGESNPVAAARQLARWGAEEVLVTRAARGCVVCHNGAIEQVPAVPAADAVDPTGCGDTFMAGYLLRRLEGADPVQAARFGAAAATLKLGHVGPFEATREGVEALL